MCSSDLRRSPSPRPTPPPNSPARQIGFVPRCRPITAARQPKPTPHSVAQPARPNWLRSPVSASSPPLASHILTAARPLPLPPPSAHFAAVAARPSTPIGFLPPNPSFPAVPRLRLSRSPAVPRLRPSRLSPACPATPLHPLPPIWYALDWNDPHAGTACRFRCSVIPPALRADSFQNPFR